MKMPDRCWYTLGKENADAEELLTQIASEVIDPSILVEANQKKKMVEIQNKSIDAAIADINAQRKTLGDEAADKMIAKWEKGKKKVPEPRITKDKIMLWLIQTAAKSEKKLSPVVKELKK